MYIKRIRNMKRIVITKCQVFMSPTIATDSNMDLYLRK